MKCYPCHKSCASCDNGRPDGCTSCAKDFREEKLGIPGVCYPIELEENFEKWKVGYSSLTKLVKKKSFRKKWEILNLINQYIYLTNCWHFFLVFFILFWIFVDIFFYIFLFYSEYTYFCYYYKMDW